ncbi:MAG: hypothetical protein QOK10_1783 [Pseudonocardiales bacterium]|jgi:uncharacterized glyoxalase superfamily metalloenzyme YdcJ|nr:hypothetical protein [Pseudonocardiales bacterium]
MPAVAQWELRARFAHALSAMYGKEVPAYTTLVEVTQQVNATVLAERGSGAERLGSIERVSAERHGAIRVGTADELRQVGQIFAAMGMHPVGFYDLRDTGPAPVPVVSTAFRPVSADELARNPFRVFTSVLAVDDRRFFSTELSEQLESFLRRRTLFSAELLELAARAEALGELPEPVAARFLQLATDSFALSAEPVDRAWYRTLEQVSSVAADIGGVASTHINHLTPRVLDIDALYTGMQHRGLEMIDAIQGPPRWDGPEVLLRQTSFRALAEPRLMRNPDGSVEPGTLRVRFGEVEARGIALSRRGRDLADKASSTASQRAIEDGVEDPGERQRLAAQTWSQLFPATERQLLLDGLGHFSFDAVARTDRTAPPRQLAGLIEGGWLEATPIVYEDFLPRSAAGIFRSNLSGHGTTDPAERGSQRDAGWLAAALERDVHASEDLYERQQSDSLDRALSVLGLDAAELVD